ncbi:hypothetical protein BH09MYX1_BH09MYX1_02810 [soil metagenome]
MQRATIVFSTLASLTFLFAGTASADEPPADPAAVAPQDPALVTPPPPPPAELPPPALRIAGDLTFGIDHFHRTKTGPLTEGGGSIGLDLRLHPTPMHGVLIGITEGGGVFGPNVTSVDAGYSLRLLGPRHVGGVTGDLVFDIGPSFAHVHVHDEPDHYVFGGRATVATHLYLSGFTAGAWMTYRGGSPLGTSPDGYEGVLSGGLSVGFVIDSGTR